jgi:hypothetical protein
MSKPVPPADLSRVKTYPLASRSNKVRVDEFARTVAASSSLGDFLDGLPDVLAVKVLRELAAAIVQARAEMRPVVVAAGAHVVKVGLAPVLIGMMEEGTISALALTGGAAIHDWEIAAIGATSLGVPATVHVAVGGDVVHQHPSADGAAIGAAAFTDFRKLVTVVSALSGGVWINMGSAVHLPEVFMKAVSIASNLGHDLSGFATANLDMIRQYRTDENVLRRPTLGKGKSFSLTGHHEINVPLLAAAVGLERARRESSR